MKYLIVPEFIYVILFFGSIILSLVSVFMEIRGIIKKSRKRYFITWCIVLLAALVMVALTTTGVIVANTMIGG